MLSIITTALSIAKMTGLDDWVIEKLGMKDDKSASLAATVLDLAGQVTGASLPDEISKALRDNKAAQIKLRELAQQNAHALEMAAYADRKSAREMYKVHNEQADKIADNVMRFNLPYIIVAAIANVAAFIYLHEENGAILAAISSVLTMTIKSLFDERKEVTGFYFGSSMGSKNKDEAAR